MEITESVSCWMRHALGSQKTPIEGRATGPWTDRNTVNTGENLSFEHTFEVIIHQIFSLAHDWSKRFTWMNIPQLKLGNIRGYSPIFKTDGY